MKITNTKLEALYIHYIGNQVHNEELILSDKTLSIEDDDLTVMSNNFLKNFDTSSDVFSFSHPASLKYNEVYQFILDFFNGSENLLKTSTEIAKHLYHESTHPKIKSGELYVCHFKNCEVDSRFVDAIGIFKTERRSPFWELNRKGNSFLMNLKEGLELKKIEKGCLVFNSNAESGFDILQIESASKSEEATYWKDSFLGLAAQNTIFNQTNQVLQIAKSYITQQLIQEFDIPKFEQIDLLNKSVEYFKKNDSFIPEVFETEVLGNSDIINSFRKYDLDFRERNELIPIQQFDISNKAVKKQEKIIKRVIKLDKNFDIYIRGNKSLIEKGVDENGRKYYKIYYNEEL